MTFRALLTKEMRLCLRRERTLWIIILYLCCMGAIGWFAISHYIVSSNALGNNDLSNLGVNLYRLLSLLQLLILIFITPAFTATAINGEKERQTFDLLACSRLSSAALISAKLLAGLVNAFLLIIAAIPFFSLAFFFSGIALEQVIDAFCIYTITVLLVGSFSLLCSSLIPRPAVSTIVAYLGSILWTMLPAVLTYILFALGDSQFYQFFPSHIRLLYMWNPISALMSTYPTNTAWFSVYYTGTYMNPSVYDAGLFGMAFGYGSIAPYWWGSIPILPWIAYGSLSLLAACGCFFISMASVRLSPFAQKRGFLLSRLSHRH
jgi:ABC-type transport system involved in multi-copper enzyme maturation permease subunit